MKEEVRKDLQGAIARIGAQNEEMLSLIGELKKDEAPIHPVFLDAGSAAGRYLAEVRRLNATLFEVRSDDAERKLRLELDEALRLQLNNIEELLKLLPREG